MTNLRTTLVLTCTVAALAVCPTLRAQTLNAAPGYSATELFKSTAGFTIDALAVDSDRNVYYLESDGAFTASTKLYKRSAADGYQTATMLFDYGTTKFGSFVEVEGSKVYFGETNTHTIRSINLDGTGALVVATITGNYDMAFYGGNAFVSSNPDLSLADPSSRVHQLDLTNGSTDMILNAAPDYSGPIVFDLSGRLIYGASFAITGIYEFSPTEIAGAVGSSEITGLDSAHRIIEGGSSASLAYDAQHSLYRTNYSSLVRYWLGSDASETVATAPGISAIDYLGNEVIANVTDFGTSRSAVYSVSVPEPGSGLLALLGLSAGLSLRRRGQRVA